MDAALRLPPDSRPPCLPILLRPAYRSTGSPPTASWLAGLFTLTYSHSSPTSPPALWRYVRLNSSIKQQKKMRPIIAD